jgi:6-phosphogluconolactonase
LANQVIVYRRGPAKTDWRETAIASTLPDGWTGASGAAALIWAAQGERLYASNRGHDSVALWRFAPDSGTLSLLGHSPVGKTPRDFALTADGRFALAAAQGEHRVICYPVAESGLLGPAVSSLACAYPSRVALLEP